MSWETMVDGSSGEADESWTTADEAGRDGGDGEDGGEGMEGIAGLLDPAYAGLARILAAVRIRAIAGIKDARARRAFFETLADDRFLDIIRREGRDKAMLAARALLEEKIAGRKKEK